MAALIPAIIKLFLKGRGGRGGGGGGGGGGVPKPKKTPDQISMEYLDKNARKAGIQQSSPRMRGESMDDALDGMIEFQNRLIQRLGGGG